MFGPLLKVGGLCLAIAGVTGAVTFVVVTHVAPGERPRDPRIAEARGRLRW